MYEGKQTFCFVSLSTRKCHWQKGSSRRQGEKAKRSFWKATQQNSFGHLTPSQLNGWLGNNPCKRDGIMAGRVPGLQADPHLTVLPSCIGQLTRGRLCTSVHVYWIGVSDWEVSGRESCLHRCLDQAQHSEARILPDLRQLTAQTTPQYFHCVRPSHLGLPAHLFW